MAKEIFKMGCPLMMACGDGRGDFVDWLKKLGLSDSFLRTYPVSKLVEWGWLRPQSRVIFPAPYFPDGSWEAEERWRDAAKQDSTLSELWDSQYFCDGEDDPMWFIHPFFTPPSKAGQLLKLNSAQAGLPAMPAQIELANGVSVSPYADYFFPWQAYALIDVIRASDCYRHFVMDTPDVQERVESLVRLTKTSSWEPHKYLDSQAHWGGHADVMTWLAHYDVLKAAVEQRELRYGHFQGVLQRGAKALAAHLGFDAPRLEGLVKGRLLVLARNWKDALQSRKRWIDDAYPHLQKEVYLAVHWLCMLTGNTLDHYLDLWRYPTLSSERWAQLHAVLPFEYYEIRDKFLQLAPIYLKPFNERLPTRYRQDGESLRATVDGIRVKNRHFNVFMGAFKKLHDELGGDRKITDVVDFRERQPLDYYLLLAIKAEVCMREELRNLGMLGQSNGIPEHKHGLEAYLEALGLRAGLDEQAIAFFHRSVKLCKNLRSEPKDAILRVQSLKMEGQTDQIALIQAMVCCELARNYFAHHDYMDAKLLNDPESQFLMGGILICVLVLLGNLQR